MAPVPSRIVAALKISPPRREHKEQPADEASGHESYHRKQRPLRDDVADLGRVAQEAQRQVVILHQFLPFPLAHLKETFFVQHVAEISFVETIRNLKA